MKKVVWPIILMVLAVNGNAAEVGDVLYSLPETMWGAAYDQYDFGDYCGHAAMFAGVDENNQEYLLHAPGGEKGVILEKIVDSGYVNGKYHRVKNDGSISVSAQNRKDMVKYGVSKIGSPYTMPNKHYFDANIPTIRQQKGYELFQNNSNEDPEETYTCVGLVERMYEEAGINLTPDGYGRDLVRQGETLYNYWEDKEGSYIHADHPIIPGYSTDAWAFMPYTQQYKQLTRTSSGNDTRMVEVEINPDRPTVTINNPIGNSTLIISKTPTIAISAQATDYSTGSGIFKVEFYSKDSMGIERLIKKVYTYSDENGNPIMDGIAGGPCFYYKDATVPIELDEYTCEWSLDSVDEGPCIITARAVDRAGNWSTTAEINVIVQKTVDPKWENIMHSETSDKEMKLGIEKNFANETGFGNTELGIDQANGVPDMDFTSLFSLSEIHFDTITYSPIVSHTGLMPFQSDGPYIIDAHVLDFDADYSANDPAVKFYYSENGGAWNSITMTLIPDDPGVLGDEYIFRVELPDKPHGTNIKYYIEAIDATNNRVTNPNSDLPSGPPSVLHEFTVDKDPPLFNVTFDNNPFSPDGNGMKDTVRIDYRIDDLSGFVNQLDARIVNDANEPVITIPTRNFIPSDGTVVNSFLWDSTSISEGKYTFEITALDRAMNQGTAQYDFWADLSPPEAMNIALSSNPGAFPAVFTRNDVSLDLTADVTEILCNTATLLVRYTTAGTTIEKTAEYSVTPGTSESILYSWDGKDGNGEWAPDGDYTAILTLTDSVGNESAEYTVPAFEIDRTPSDITSLYVDNALFTPDDADGDRDTVTLVYEFSEPATVSIEINNNIGQTILTNTKTTLMTGGSFTWDGRFSGEFVSDGIYEYVVTTTDDVGNQTYRTLQIIKNNVPAQISFPDDGIEVGNTVTVMGVAVDPGIDDPSDFDCYKLWYRQGSGIDFLLPENDPLNPDTNIWQAIPVPAVNQSKTDANYPKSNVSKRAVTNSILGDWDTSGLVEGQQYTVMLVTMDLSGHSSYDFKTVTVNQSIDVTDPEIQIVSPADAFEFLIDQDDENLDIQYELTQSSGQSASIMLDVFKMQDAQNDVYDFIVEHQFVSGVTENGILQWDGKSLLGIDFVENGEYRIEIVARDEDRMGYDSHFIDITVNKTYGTPIEITRFEVAPEKVAPSENVAVIYEFSKEADVFIEIIDSVNSVVATYSSAVPIAGNTVQCYAWQTSIEGMYSCRLKVTASDDNSIDQASVPVIVSNTTGTGNTAVISQPIESGIYKGNTYFDWSATASGYYHPPQAVDADITVHGMVNDFSYANHLPFHYRIEALGDEYLTQIGRQPARDEENIMYGKWWSVILTHTCGGGCGKHDWSGGYYELNGSYYVNADATYSIAFKDTPALAVDVQDIYWRAYCFNSYNKINGNDIQDDSANNVDRRYGLNVTNESRTGFSASCFVYKEIWRGDADRDGVNMGWFPLHPRDVKFDYTASGIIDKPELEAHDANGYLWPLYVSPGSPIDIPFSMTLLPNHGGQVVNHEIKSAEPGTYFGGNDYDDNSNVHTDLINWSLNGDTYSGTIRATNTAAGIPETWEEEFALSSSTAGDWNSTNKECYYLKPLVSVDLNSGGYYTEPAQDFLGYDDPGKYTFSLSNSSTAGVIQGETLSILADISTRLTWNSSQDPALATTEGKIGQELTIFNDSEDYMYFITEKGTMKYETYYPEVDMAVPDSVRNNYLFWKEIGVTPASDNPYLYIKTEDAGWDVDITKAGDKAASEEDAYVVDYRNTNIANQDDDDPDPQYGMPVKTNDNFTIKMAPNKTPKRFLDIRGETSTEAQGFEGYSLYYKKNSDSIWRPIGDMQTTPVEAGGLLGMWDVTQLNGLYDLKMVVLDTGGDKETIKTMSVGQEALANTITVVSAPCNKAYLTIPENSLSSDALITVAPVDPRGEGVIPDANMPVPIGPIYKLLPEGLTFDLNKPAWLSIRLLPEEITGIDVNSLCVYYLKEDGTIESLDIPAPTTEWSRDHEPVQITRIDCPITHFSKYMVVAKIAPPQMDVIASPTNVQTHTLTGTTEADADVEIFINGGKTADVKAGETGQFAVTITLVTGQNRITAQATRVFGNSVETSDESEAMIVVYDTQIPLLSNVGDSPDPFTPNGDGTDETTQIEFDLSEPSIVNVDVKTQVGQTVRTLTSDTELIAGHHSIVWDGDDDSSQPAAVGTYDYVVVAVDTAGNQSNAHTGEVTLTLPTWIEDFLYSQAGLNPDERPTGWIDNENSGNIFNAELIYDNTDSFARIKTSTGEEWGKVHSPNLTLDIDYYPNLEVDIESITDGRMRLFVFRNKNANWEQYECPLPNSQPGVHAFDVKALTGWSGVVDEMGVVMVVDGQTAEGVVDSLRFYHGEIPTPEPTPVTEVLWEETFNYSDDDPVSTSGELPPTWNDNTVYPDFNGNLQYDTTDGLGVISTEIGADWGKVISKSMEIDVNYHNLVEVDVNALDVGDLRLFIFKNENNIWEQHECDLGGEKIGMHTFDIRDVTGWNTVVNEAGVLLVVDGQGAQAKLDKIKIYHGNIPTPEPTPIPTVLWEENFNYSDDDPASTAGELPKDWQDDSVYNDFNALLAYDQIDGLGVISTQPGELWGKVHSKEMTIDVDYHSLLEIIIHDIPDGDFRLFIFKNENGQWEQHECNLPEYATGLYTFDIPRLTGWSGVQNNVGVVLVVDGPVANTFVDNIRIYHGEMPTPTATVTNTLTATPTVTPTVSPSKTATPTVTASPTCTSTVTASPSGTVTPTATPSATPSATWTATMTATVTWTATPIPDTVWQDHFLFSETDSAPGGRPESWKDDAVDNGLNAMMYYAATDSYAKITPCAGETWGKVEYHGLQIDLDYHSNLEIDLEAISNGSVRLFVVQEVNSVWEQYECPLPQGIPGIYAFSLPEITSWSGMTMDMRIIIVVEGESAEAIVDSMRIYHGELPTMTVTPTMTNTSTPTWTHTASLTNTISPTASPTITASPTFSPSATSTPRPDTLWQDHFSYVEKGVSAGEQPVGWQDETDEAAFNAEIAYQATDSLAGIMTNSGESWGKVQYNGLMIDLDYYTNLEIDVHAISNGNFRIFIGRDNQGVWEQAECIFPNTIPGIYTFDISNVTGWSGIIDAVSIIFVTEGSAAEAVVDQVRIYHGIMPTRTGTPSATPSMTATPSVTNTTTMTTSPTPTQTPVPDVLWEDPFEYSDDDPVSAPGDKPVEWYDETDNSAFNASLTYNTTDGFATLATVSGETWGKCISVSRSVNLAMYPYLEVKISEIDDGAVKIFICSTESGWEEHYCTLEPVFMDGTYIFNIADITGWSGTKNNVCVQIIIDGEDGSAVLDSVSIHGKDVNAIITAPVQNSTLTEAIVAVTGTAKSDANKTFREYRVYQSLYQGESETLIAESTTPVANARLTTWDISQIGADQVVSLRLVVDFYEGESEQYRTQVKIGQVQGAIVQQVGATWTPTPQPTSVPQITAYIQSPCNQSLVNGIVHIVGVAQSGNGKSFGSYALQYRRQGQTKMILQSGKSVSQNILGVWDTCGLEDGIYDLMLTVRFKDGSTATHQVCVFKGEWEFAAQLGSGEKGTRTDEFNLPWDASMDPYGSLFVSDSMNNRVKKYNAQDQYVSTIGAGGKRPGEFNCPTHMAIDAQNRLLVVDSQNQRIQVFDLDGQYVKTLTIGDGQNGWTQQNQKPMSVATTPSGTVYVLDNCGRIYRLNENDSLVLVGQTEGSFLDMAIGKSEELSDTMTLKSRLFVDRVRSKDGMIEKLDDQGEKQYAYKGTSGYCEPQSIQIGPLGNVWITDQFKHRIQVFGPYGNLLASLGKFGSQPGTFDVPRGIAFKIKAFVEKMSGSHVSQVDAYVVDSGNQRVQKFTYTLAASVPLTPMPTATPAPYLSIVGLQARPNVFVIGQGTTTIEFLVSQKCHVELSLLSQTGRYIRDLGIHEINMPGIVQYRIWDGRNNMGNFVIPGRYTIHAVARTEKAEYTASSLVTALEQGLNKPEDEPTPMPTWTPTPIPTDTPVPIFTPTPTPDLEVDDCSASPNPFRPANEENCVIRYRLNMDARVTITLHQQNGPDVQVYGPFAAGTLGGSEGMNAVEWSGSNASAIAAAVTWQQNPYTCTIRAEANGQVGERTIQIVMEVP